MSNEANFYPGWHPERPANPFRRDWAPPTEPTPPANIACFSWDYKYTYIQFLSIQDVSMYMAMSIYLYHIFPSLASYILHLSAHTLKASRCSARWQTDADYSPLGCSMLMGPWPQSHSRSLRASKYCKSATVSAPALARRARSRRSCQGYVDKDAAGDGMRLLPWPAV